MAFQSVFSVRSISRVVRSGDSQRFAQNLAANGPAIVEAISLAAIARTVVLTGYVRAKVRAKLCISYTSYPTNLVLRSITSYLARRFRVVPANRDRIVAGAVESMMDATPFHVIRRDVTSFYESIDSDSLRQRLVYDTSLPRSVRHYLTLFFDAHCQAGHPGLPRGIGLTAILAELAMEHFDRQVRSLPGVYRYFRYSDDIVVFAYANTTQIETMMSELLPKGMEFNKKKSATVDFTKKDKGIEKSIEYLGYKISTLSGTGGKQPRKVAVTISDKKIDRLKSRIILSLKSFKKNYDSELLIDRLMLISSNYQIKRRGINDWGSGTKIRSGIYYNYRKCGGYEGNSFSEAIPSALSSLDDLTHMLIKSPRSEFRTPILMNCSSSQLQRLKKISFRLGFSSRRMVRLPYTRLTIVKGAWRNA